MILEQLIKERRFKVFKINANDLITIMNDTKIIYRKKKAVYFYYPIFNELLKNPEVFVRDIKYDYLNMSANIRCYSESYDPVPDGANPEIEPIIFEIKMMFLVDNIKEKKNDT